MSIRPRQPGTVPLEEVAERLLALPTPPPSPLSPYSSSLPQIPSLPLPIPSQPSNSPIYEDDIIYSQLDDGRHNRALLRARVNMLYRDRPFHRRTALLMKEEARVSRAAWAQSAESRLSETKTVSRGTKDSEEPQDSDDRALETAGTC
ncbi:hypothetical protein Tco_0624356 [Tanacetum coccineum]|uniref:Uncharacterized protein n=1 Tax=Tanacetum coccineum TaxID=301880 RepID=A0ABQ4WDQ9_9ASTR